MRLALIALAAISAVASLAHGGIIDDFDGGSLGTWRLNDNPSRSSLSVVTTNVHGGSHALLWTYSDDGSTRWGNSIRLVFTGAQDWSQAESVTLYFDTGLLDASSGGRRVYMSLYNGTTSVFGTSFSFDATAGYEPVPILLGSAGVTSVSEIRFYVDGNDYHTGTQQFYLDDIAVNMSVPEPASLGLLAVAGAALLKRAGR